MLKELQEFGLSYYESKAIEALLMRSLTMKELSKAARIPYGKVFSICNSLQKRGILQFSEERPKKAYIENPPEIFSRLIAARQKDHEENISQIREILAQIEFAKKKTSKFFEIGSTLEDNKEIQLRTFKEAQEEVCQILNIHHKPRSNRMIKTIWEGEIVNAVKRGVVFRCIYPKNCILPNILEGLQKKYPQLFQVRRLNTDFVRCDIIDGKKVLLKFVHADPLNFGGVLFIEHESFVRNLQKIFEHFWEEAK